MTTWAWLPATKERILDPAMAAMDPELRAAVEADLDTFLQDPTNPPTWNEEWRGDPDTHVQWRSRVAVVADGRVSMRYFVLRDYPYVGVIALVELPA